VCRKCYEVGVVKKNNIVLDDALPDELVACTLKCHKKASNVTVNNNGPSTVGGQQDDSQNWHRRTSWDNDTPTGAYEGSSEALLYDWLKQPGQFAYWKGNSQGISKIRIQHQVAKDINEEGFRRFGGPMRTRTAVQVGSKIAYIVAKFQKTYNWSHQTGQGIKDERNLDEHQFKDLVSAQFPQYWDLFDVMAERSSTRPVFSSDDLDIEDEDEEEDEEEEEEEEGEEEDLVVVDTVTNPDTNPGRNDAVLQLQSEDDDSHQDRGPTRLFADVLDSSDEDEDEDAGNATGVASPVPHVYIVDQQEQQPSSGRTMESSGGKTTSSRKRGNDVAASARKKRTATTGGSLVSSASFTNSVARQQQQKKQQSVATSRRAGSTAAVDTHQILSAIHQKMDGRGGANNSNHELEMKRLDIEAGAAAEVKRHNMEMEGIERNKLAASTVDAARSETTYSLELVREYNKMKQDFPHYTVKDTAKMFPQFIVCFSETDLSNVSEADKTRFVERYNKWNEERGLKARLDFL
jgi:hypothetical protein